jgi:hypothetical protein
MEPKGSPRPSSITIPARFAPRCDHPRPRQRAFLLAISPDGEQIAFVGCKDESCLLYVGIVGARRAGRWPTPRGRRPFFSPDGRSIGFGANGKLKTVAANGGPVVTLADAAAPRELGRTAASCSRTAEAGS